ncbi:trace amine-associated receptor 9-like [Erpetoichthys calabaricus]|uniref:trace amine-associated receptor 9-like n=1 Tax=Erpetoichthys calabaricus TaxID=27687 RepID=UPI0022342FB8|nr:trace amine-associated receptor 9-like [Erpetoichthys calabaricus]
MDLNVGHCYTNNNKSCIKLDREPETSLLLYFFSGVVIVATVFGNLLVVISVSHFKQLHTPTNFLVLSLAVADFLIGLLVMPFEFSSTIEYCWYFGKGICPFYLNYAILLSSASVAHLVVISMDRYIAVCHPFFYSSKMTNAVMAFCIALVWLVSLLFTLIFLHFSGGSIDMEECDGLCRIIHSAFWWSVYLVFIFALPVAIMIFLYAIIFLVAKSHARAIRASVQKMENGESKKSNLSKSSERKAAKTLGIVVAVFIICVSPNFLIGPILESLPAQSLSSLFMYDLHDGFGLLFVINYGMNPFIYAFFYPWFQKSLKMMATFKIFQPASSLTNLFPEK